MTLTLKERAAAIRLLALDVDGVLTDGSINIAAEGEIFKSFNAKDGLGLSLALRLGLKVAVITGRKSAIVAKRLQELGVKLLFQDVKDKFAKLDELSKELGLSREEVAYMGDDLNDLPAFCATGLKFAPADAAPEVKEAADLVTEAQGGRGAVRQAVEFLLKARGLWQDAVTSYNKSKEGEPTGSLFGDRQ